MTLILDHINGSNHDDRLENLRWVCPNCNQQLDTTNGKNKVKTSVKIKIKEEIEEKKYFCEKCGAEITRNSKSGLCFSCSTKEKRTCERPTREELKKLIRTVPFTRIAEQYGVSDNAIRKWCDAENLPRTKREIQSYSDEQWALI